MSHLPADAHRRLERTCADGAACQAFVPRPPGRCVKAGRVTLEQALAAPVTLETGKPRVVLPIRTELLGVKQRPECNASGPAADGSFTCDCAPGECPGFANAKLLDTALALAKGVLSRANPAPYAAQPAVPSPSTEVQIGAPAGPHPVARVVPYEATVRLEWASVEAAHNAKPGPLYAVPVAVAPPSWKVTAVEPAAPIPPAALLPAEREALTDEQILACVRSVGLPVPMGLTRDSGPYEVTEPTWFLIQLVRAIERAHGIDAAMAQRAEG